jgi:non-homologous end joining protein Ku
MARTRATRSTWSGSINFAGFPIHVRAFGLVKSRSSQSFKTLAPDGLPVSQQYVDSSGEVVTRDQCSKGIEVSANQYAVLPPEAVEMIQAAERTDTLEVERFSPLHTVPLHLSVGQYRLIPNEKVPGSEGPVNILWNGLYASERALITKWVPRAGARDTLFVVHADRYGLNANTLPFASELQDPPEWKPDENEQAQQMFEQFVGINYVLDDFELSAFSSEYEVRREEAVTKALAGEIIEAPSVEDTPAAAVPDLMAAMQNALTSAKPTAKKSKPKAKAAA